MKKNIVIITAAGSGKRMNSRKKKQYLEISGKPVLAHTIQKFSDMNIIDDIVIVCSEKDIDLVRADIVEKYSFDKVRDIIPGGKERQDSVFNALNKIRCRYDDIILIHDGVRPFVSDLSIISSVEQAVEYGAAVVGIKPVNTIKTLRSGRIHETLDRDRLFSVQTPQCFHYQIIKNCYEKAYEEGFYSTDDSALVERYADHIQIIPVDGTNYNIKITTPEDLTYAEAILKNI